MAQVQTPSQREMMKHNIGYNHEKQQATQDKQELIMLRSEVQQQSQTIESLTLKIKTVEHLNTQLLEQITKLRADNTTLRQKNTKIDREKFQLGQAYDHLLQKFNEVQTDYHFLQNSLTRSM